MALGPLGPWTRLGSHVAYANERVQVSIDTVLSPGHTHTTFTVVDMQRGSAVVAVDDESNVYLVREFRYALGRDSVEAIGGGSHAGESFLETATREAREEAGIVAEVWTGLGHVEPMTGNLRATSALWLATGLSFVPRRLEDPFEQLDVVRMPLAEAVGKVLAGDIVHAPSCVALLRAGAHLGCGMWPEYRQMLPRKP